MKYQDFIKKAKSKQLSGVFHIFGHEDYLINLCLKYLKNILKEDFREFNIEIIKRKIDLEELVSKCETIPLMDEKRIVIVEDFELFVGKKANFSDRDEEYFIEYLDKLNSTTILVFVSYFEIDKRKSFYKKTLKKIESIQLKKVDKTELYDIVKEFFKKENLKVEMSELIYFLKMVDYESKDSNKTLYDIKNEIKKISAFNKGNQKLEKEIIDKVCIPKLEDNLFLLIDYIGEKNSSRALKVLNDIILEQKSPLMILIMISRQFKIMIQLKELLEVGYSPKVMSEKLGIHPFIVSKTLNVLKNFTKKELITNLNKCSELDYDFKRGIIQDKLGIEIIIAQMVN